jgi:hypothetical protein
MCREKDPAYDKGYKAIQSVLFDFNQFETNHPRYEMKE